MRHLILIILLATSAQAQTYKVYDYNDDLTSYLIPQKKVVLEQNEAVVYDHTDELESYIIPSKKVVVEPLPYEGTPNKANKVLMLYLLEGKSHE